ncbi:MAG: HAD family phosphatase [Bacteroidia bacterium]|nr:HAD family phosphatase [Bacteroidia bacterium]
MTTLLYLTRMQGLIFDMDGTMVDNMMVHHRAWQIRLAELGLEMTLEEVHREIHGKNEEIIERLFGDRFTPEERRQVAWEKEARYREVFKDQLRPLDGLMDLLAAAQAAGIPMGIGTAAPPENVHFVLDHLPLRPYFRAVVDSGVVSKGKPDPEVFIRVAEAIGVPVTACLVFEDSPTGAETARRAGCPAFILTTTHAAAEFAHFPHIIGSAPDYRGLDLHELLGRAAAWRTAQKTTE